MLTKEKQELIKVMSEQGVTIRSIMQVVGCSENTVNNYRRHFGVQGTRYKRIGKEIVEKLNAGAMVKDLAREFHCSTATIYKAARSPDCSWPSRHCRKENEDITYRRNEMKKLRELGYEYSRIGRIFNVTRQRVEQIINDTYEHTSSIQPELAERNTVNDASSEH